MQAGRDITLTAAQVSIKDDARLQAGRDINLATLTESHGESLVLNKKNRHDLATSKEIGSTIEAGGNVTLIAGQDVNARAANVTAGAQLAVGAGRDINLTAGVQSGSAYDETHYKTRGFLSSKTTHTKNALDWEQSLATTFTGDTAVLMAGRDLTVAGSNVVADRDVHINAGRDLQILAAEEAYNSYQYEKVKKSGFGGGGFSTGYNKQERTDWMKGESGGYSSSTIGSVGGDLFIDAGRDIGVMGSNLLAQDGNISIVGRNVAILAGVGEARQHEYHDFKQSGVTVGVGGGGVLGTMQKMHGTLKQASDAKDGRLAAVKVGQAAYQAIQADRMMDAAKDPDASMATKEAANAQIQISIGSSKSVSETKRTQQTSFGSSVMAGGNVSIVALGDKEGLGSGNLAIIGSDIAGRNVLLAATNDLLLQGQAQTSTETSKNKSSGWNVGVGIGVSDGGGGINVFASGYAGSGSAVGNGTTYRETQVSARDTLALISGHDTLIQGAQARADQIRADIGHDLLMASQQDSDRYDAKQKQVSGGASFSFGSMTGSVNLGASQGKTKSNYDSVIEQTGLYAGKGGFDIYVGKHTQLDGAVIASVAEASNNRLSTETLGFSDIRNKADYSSSTTGISLGTSGAFDKPNKEGALGGKSGGFTFGSTSGDASGTTRTAVAEGTINVRSDKDTGRDSTAGLSRDTVGANGSIGKIFDKDKVREQLEFQQALGQLGMQIAGDVLKDMAKKDPDTWGEGKIGSMAVHAGVAGVAAALSGGNVAGAMAGTVAGDLASSAIRAQIDQAVAGLPPELRDTVEQLIINAVAASAGGLAGGLSGAGGAAVADMYNRQLHPDERALAKKLAESFKARGMNVSVEQIEEQMRWMGVQDIASGIKHDGGPDLQVGSLVQTDVGASWSRQPGDIYVQNLVKIDYALQWEIAAELNNSSVPSLTRYIPMSDLKWTGPTSEPWWHVPAGVGSKSDVLTRYCVTAECAAGVGRVMTNAEAMNQRMQAADAAAVAAAWSGRVAASATTAGRPDVALAATVAGGVAGLIEQIMRPNPSKAANDSLVDWLANWSSAVSPKLSPVFTEMGELLKSNGYLGSPLFK